MSAKQPDVTLQRTYERLQKLRNEVRDAGYLTSGVLDAARIPDLNASKITAGVFDRARLPATVAYEDEANTFTLNQLLSKTHPTWELLHSGTQKGRLQALTAHQTGFSQNLSYNGSFNLDDTAQSGWMARLIGSVEGDTFEVIHATAGANPRTPVTRLTINSVGATVPNNTGWRMLNAAGSASIALIWLDTANRHNINCNSTALALTNAFTVTTVGAAGAAAALPANPVGYVRVLIGGASMNIPYYNA